jgi:Zn-finger nucleic acid-binding protein
VNCPRCETSTLDERDRNGVTVDVCPACRGVWLDRGELEKMLATVHREVEQERAHYGYEQQPPSSDRRGYASGHHDPRYGKRRKKGWLENLGDIFD